MLARRLYKTIRSLARSPEAQRLYKLDMSSTRFPEQLNELLHDEGWVEHLHLLPKGELVGLIGYLDNVRFVSTPT